MAFRKTCTSLQRSLNCLRLTTAVTRQSNASQATLLGTKNSWDSSAESHMGCIINPLGERGFRTGLAALDNVNVEVQSMGESISEGTIAEVLKQEGDSVEEDETIMQIDTDKVTIDIKAPKAGKLAQIKVKKDDTVEVGQVVATVSEGEAEQGDQDSSSSSAQDTSKQNQKQKKQSSKKSREKGKKASEKSDNSQQQAQQASEESQAQGASEQQQAEKVDEQPQKQEAYEPSVKFPLRMTPDGQRISELPAAEQKQYSQSGSGQGSSSKPEQSDGGGHAESTKPAPQPPKSFITWYVGKEQGTKLSQSSVLSDFEMEQIELGGAEP